MAEIVAYAAADNNTGFQEIGTVGIYKTFADAKDRIDRAYRAQKNAGFVILLHAADQLVSLEPGNNLQRAYWIIHV